MVARASILIGMVVLATAISWAMLAAPSQALGTGTSVTVTLNPTSIVADGTSTSTATATVTDALGQSVAGEAVVFSSSAGPTVPGQDNGNGTYTATFTSTTTVGSQTITATDTSSLLQPSGSKTLTQTAGPATAVRVTLSPPSVVADGRSPSTATATVTDAQGHLLIGQTVNFSSSSGQAAPGRDNGNGTYTATFTSTTAVGSQIITATDSSVTPAVSGSQTLTQTAGPAAKMSLTLNPASIPADGTSTSTATVTVTDAQGHPLSGQRIGFLKSDPGEKIGPVTDHANGTYTATITSSTTVHTTSLIATDTSVSPPPLAQAFLTQTAGAPTTVTVTLSPGSILADGSSTSTATATIKDAAGHPLGGQTVGFSSSDPGQTIGRVTDHGDGTYTATITSSRTVGFATITATDSSLSPHASGQATLGQAASGSTTTMTTLPAASVTNQGVTLIATVTSGSSTTAPSGTVTFETGGNPISGCALVPVATSGQSATVTCQASFSAATSPEHLVAVFTSNRGSVVADSTSARDDLVVSPDATSTALDVSNPTVKVGSRATYTATVAPSHPGPAQPSGSVEFLDRGAPIATCANQPLVNGGAFAAATCTVTYKKTGQHLITARYRGDASFYGSSSPSQPVRVHRRTRGTITSTMHWTFYYTPAYTKVLALIVQHALPGTAVLVECRGAGCPFAKHATAVTKPKPCTPRAKHHCPSAGSGTVNLVRSFRKHRLHAGALINVKLTRPNLIGKSYLFKFRAGHPPRIQIRCLAPGGTRPGVGC